MSQKYDNLKAFQDAVDTETTRIAGEFQKLLDELAGGVTSAEADDLIARGTPLVEKLKAIASGGPVV